MTDRKYGDYSRLLRVPELRMLDADMHFVTLEPPVDLVVRKPGMASYYYLLKGALRLYPDADDLHWIDVAEGSSIGLEDGSHHRLTALPEHDGAVEVVTGSVDRRHTIIQRLMKAVVIMPADAEPHASIVRHCIAAIATNGRRHRPNAAITRRLVEVIQLEMLLYAESSLAEVGPIPDVIRHDAALLRAWTSFLNDPARAWTLAALAESAGISRTVFASRFRLALGTTPLAAIRDTRVRYAADMLRSTEAPISEIALKVGYGSDIALMRAFRQVLEVTPARWRAMARQPDGGEGHRRLSGAAPLPGRSIANSELLHNDRSTRLT